jgi:tetratricopeptide (TPR) repeat protein
VRRSVATIHLIGIAACGGGVKTIPPTLEGFSLLGDTLWSVPVPVLGGRERVTRLQDARERLNQAPGNFQAAYDVARYTADLGRFSQAIELYGAASSMGGLDPRPYARRGELYLLLRRLDRALSDLRTAGRLYSGYMGDSLAEQQVTATGEMVRRNFSYTIPSLLGIAYSLRGDSVRSVDYLNESALHVESLREAIQVTLWFRAAQPGGEFPRTLPARFRSATTAMIRTSTRGNAAAGCPIITGTMVDGDLACYVHGARLLAAGKRDEALAAFSQIRQRSHWSSQAHLAAEAALSRLNGEDEAGLGSRRGSK